MKIDKNPSFPSSSGENNPCNKDNQSSKGKFFMKWAGLDLLALTISGISAVTLTSSNICLNEYMPKWLADNLELVNYPHEFIREFVAPNNPFLIGAVVGPLTEELHYRFLIQELLFKQLPKKILGKISPSHVDLVDSKVAKCARVITSSILFALPHYISPELAEFIYPSQNMSCILSNKVFMAFGTGLVLSALQETTGHIAYPIIAHMLHNAIPSMYAHMTGMDL